MGNNKSSNHTAVEIPIKLLNKNFLSLSHKLSLFTHRLDFWAGRVGYIINTCINRTIVECGVHRGQGT